MKKVIKWIWYNKEQLVSIIYNLAAIVITNNIMWNDTISVHVDELAQLPVFANIGGDMAVKITAIVLSVAVTILTIRNVCVKYGLSSLETIDAVLAERAAKKKNKLTAAQKKEYKNLISVLQGELAQKKAELKDEETQLAKITEIYKADNHLVNDFVMKRQQYEKKIATNKANITSIEGKITEYKAILKRTKSANE